MNHLIRINVLASSEQSGFTLIELVMVIVILGILSAFALPRFANLSDEATVASLEGLMGAMKSTAAVVKAQAQVEGKITGSQTIQIEGNNIAVYNGHISASWNESWRFALAPLSDTAIGANTVCTRTYCGRGQDNLRGYGTRNTSAYLEGFSRNDNCYVLYHNGHQPGGDGQVAWELVTDGCS